MAIGLVLKAQSGSFHVESAGVLYRCGLRGRLRLERGRKVFPVAVGDRVGFTPGEELEGGLRAGVIDRVEPRISKLSRRASGRGDTEQILVANLDTLLIVTAVREPVFRRGFIDRLIVSAESGGMEPVLVMNKMDLSKEEGAPEEVLGVYEALGYRVFRTSVSEGTGLEALGEFIHRRMSVMIGPSGAGKSSLAAAIEPGLELRISAVSSKTGKGRHTTTHLELHPLSGGGYMADTPGVREFGLWEVEPGELRHYFREMEALEGECHFSECSHSHEPKCAVQDAVARGEIDRERWRSYCRLLSSLQSKSG